MTAPFTASNGWQIVPGETERVPIMNLVLPDGSVARWQGFLRAELTALVEYAATIGITAPSAVDPVTESQRASAARIRIAAERKAGRKTEKWINELAHTEPGEGV